MFGTLKRTLAIGTVIFVGLFSDFSMAETVYVPKKLVGPPDLIGIEERGQLVVAMVSSDNPPFHSDNHGHLEGIDVDLSNAIAAAIGVEVVFDRSAKTFDEVVAKVVNGEADIAVSKISRTNARAMVVAFSKPYLRLKNALMFNRLNLAQKSKGKDLGDYVRSFDGKIGVIQKSAFVDFGKQRFPLAEIVEFKTWNEIVDATISGEIDAAYRDEFEVRRITEDLPESSIKLRPVAIADAVGSISVAVSWKAPRLLAIVNQAVDDRPSALTVDDVIVMYRKSTAVEGEH